MACQLKREVLNIQNIWSYSYGVIPCQIKQISKLSPAQIFDFAGIFFYRNTDMYSDESKNIKCHE